MNRLIFCADLLGSRLESEGNGEYLADAQLCYVVAGNIDQLVLSWNLSVAKDYSPHALQVGKSIVAIIIVINYCSSIFTFS